MDPFPPSHSSEASLSGPGPGDGSDVAQSLPTTPSRQQHVLSLIADRNALNGLTAEERFEEVRRRLRLAEEVMAKMAAARRKFHTHRRPHRVAPRTPSRRTLRQRARSSRRSERRVARRARARARRQAEPHPERTGLRPSIWSRFWLTDERRRQRSPHSGGAT